MSKVFGVLVAAAALVFTFATPVALAASPPAELQYACSLNTNGVVRR